MNLLPIARQHNRAGALFSRRVSSTNVVAAACVRQVMLAASAGQRGATRVRCSLIKRCARYH
jgi:hypothetical protein